MSVHFSYIKDDLLISKKITKDTGWKNSELPPRYSALPATRPTANRWEWRCFYLESDDGRKFRLLLEVSPALGKWKSMLIKVPIDGEPIALMRLEDQPGKYGGGLHVHAHCDQISDICGAESVKMPYTLPEHRRYRRRRSAWTKALFCKSVGEFFRTEKIEGQEEMAL